jgi:hypothetical protein
MRCLEAEGGGEGTEQERGGKKIESQVGRGEFILFLFLTRSCFRIGMPWRYSLGDQK